MTARVWVGGRPALITLSAVTALWASWSLATFLGRISGGPGSLGDLVDRQLTGLIPATVVAAAGAAYVTARLRRRGTLDLLLASARPSWQLSLRPILEVSAAVGGGWIIYWVVTSFRFAQTPDGAHANVMGLLVSLVSILLAAALGHLIAVLGLGPISVPVAAVLAYGLALGAAIADDTWTQGLFPSLGPSVDEDTSVLWFLAESMWLLGVALTLTWLASQRLAAPRQRHKAMILSAAALCAVGSVGIAILGVT